MSVSFFNPAVLLPNAEVAVKPVPADNNLSFAIGTALQQVSKMAQEHYDVNSLKAEANTYADYLEDKSPEAAQLLRAQAQNFRTGITDTNQVRGSLFKSAIELAKLEQSEKKAEAMSTMNRVDNLYGTKLTAMQNDVQNMLRLKTEWDTNYNARRKAYEEQRMEAARSRVRLPRWVEEKNPYDAELSAKQRSFTQMLNQTPDVAPKSYPAGSTGQSSVSGGSPAGFVPPTSGGGGIFPSYGPESDLPSNPVNTGNTLLTPPQLTEDSGPPAPETPLLPPPAAPDPSSPSLNENRLPPTEDGTTDPAEVELKKAEESAAATIKAVTGSINSAIQTLNDNLKYYLDPKSVERVQNEAKNAIAELEALPNPGSATWVQQAKIITDRIKSAIDGLPKNTVAQENREEQDKSKQSFQVYVTGDTKKEPITITRVETGAGVRYYIMDKDGQRKSDVTQEYVNGVYTPMSATPDLKSLVDPNMPIPSAIQRFIQLGKIK